MKTKILFIALLFFTLLALKSNGQTNTTQTLDEKYPYYSIFFDKEKITEQQYTNLNETRRIELFEKYRTEIEENEDELDDVMTGENVRKFGDKHENATIRLLNQPDTLKKK